MANMMVVQDIRNGTTFMMDGQPWLGLKYEHIKMGRGSATIRIKARNLLTGTTVEKSFVNSARVEEVETVKRPMQYLYKEGASFIFMDPSSYEQVEIEASVLGEQAAYLQEGVLVNILFWDARALWVELPPKMTFKIVETDPGIKGNSAANMYKSAKLDNGLTVRVPLFIDQDEEVVIDTSEGKYVERANAVRR